MPLTSSVFFVFSTRAVARLVADPALLLGIDCVISGVPGISLDAIGDKVEHLTLEQALSEFNITQRDISAPESAYCSAVMDKEVMAQALPVLGAGADESVRLALLNHVGLLTHSAFSFDLLFKALVGNGLHQARMFRFHGRFKLVERMDIRTLLQVELSFGPQLVHLCAEMGVSLDLISYGDRLIPFKNALRDLLLLGFKGKTLLQRSHAARQLTEPRHCDAAFVVRARTEVASAEPLLRQRAAQGKKDIMLVDDLIKSPDGTAAASATTREWLPLHGFSSPLQIVSIFARCIALRGVAARLGMTLRSDRVTEWGFLGCKDNATQVLYTVFASVPELLVHRVQLDKAIERLRPHTLVSFDTVDRWGALQGERARYWGIRSVMVQNTSVDDIFYPWPLSMDHLVVGNQRLRRIFIASGAHPDRVHAFGLPLQDDVLMAGNDRLESLIRRAEQADQPLRVLVATQPFVQEFDYNAALVADLEEATKDSGFQIEWILKPHPREEARKYDAVCTALSSRGVRVAQFSGPFEHAMELVDLVVSRTSTSLEFAALGGVPGIAYLDRYPRDITDRLDYLCSAVTDKSFNKQELHDLFARFAPKRRLATLMEYSERRGYFLDEFFPAKGHATERVAEIIESGSIPC